MPRVRFLPLDAVVEVPPGTTIFDAGARAKAGIDTACVGKGTCGLCRVKIIDGADSLSPPADEDYKHLGNVYHLTRVRLACRVTVASADITVELAPRRRPPAKR